MDRSQNALVLALAAGAVLAFTALAGAARADEPATIRVSGEAHRFVAPDLAIVEIGVVTESKQAERAGAENARKLEATLAALKGALGGSARIETQSYSLEPRYEHRNGRNEIVGYRATNVLAVRTTSLQRLGEIIDLASQAGANQIRQLRFELEDSSSIVGELLADAARKARAKARSLAAALDVRIERVRSVEEAGAPVVPVRSLGFAAAESARTPVEPGRVDVRASVAITFEIGT